MVRGHGADREISAQLSAKYNIPVLVATMAQVDAFRALGLKKLVGMTYFQEALNRKFAKFLEDDGFVVKAMAGIDVPFKDAGKISPEAIYSFAKKLFIDHGPVDGIYMLGAGWHNLPVIEMLEKDLKTTVVSSIPAQVWATKKILHLNEPVNGYGRLLLEMP
jgi:maleate cis-trans isomerase